MPSNIQQQEEFELLNQNSHESDEEFDLDEAFEQSGGLASVSYANESTQSSLRSYISRLNPLRSRFRHPTRSSSLRKGPRAPRGSIRRICKPSRRLCFAFQSLVTIIVILIIFTAVFRPSYAHPPAHYQTLRHRVERSGEGEYGLANPENEKIFIAASLYDEGGFLLAGAWGDAVLKLLDMLGNKNVFLSVYENQSGDEAEVAQIRFGRKVQCQHSMVYDKEFSMDDVENITLPDRSERTKRIAYLAEVRNKALLPLTETQKDVKYDRLLFLNDVIFDPVEAAQLLLSTNLDHDGRASYHAACAVDFINPFKFYDTFATRDMEGYSMGVPFFPWFTDSGKAISRKDVLAGKDAVRVKSCWGGMVAFDAKPFQAVQPLRFRATLDLYWDASECCLIHADLMKPITVNEDGNFVGVYMNPFVRVAYGKWTLGWLHFTRRFERLYTIPHTIINHLVGLPWLNPRRTEEPGAKVEEVVWMSVDGSEAGGTFQTVTREATGDGFCGLRMLQLIKESPRNGEKNWEKMPVPPG